MSIPIQIPMTVSVDSETVPMTLGTEINMQDASGKADKVAGAVAGDFAGLDENGNLTDSGKKASDFATTEDISGFYTKPSGGIPSTDLSSGVQSSLRLADSAYQKPSGGIPATDLASGVIPDVPVQDVQVNGTSVLNNGVANIPMASTTKPGVVKYSNSSAIVLDGNGSLLMRTASTSSIREGTNVVLPSAVANQHESAFYGLCKAAGVDMASSSNAVGTYTDAAKVAIQKMLGIYEAPWELIREDEVTNATEADIEIAVDGNGNAFELTDVYIAHYLPTQVTDASVDSSGKVEFYYYSNVCHALMFGSTTQSAGSYPKGAWGMLSNDNGAVIARTSAYVTTGTDRNPICSRNKMEAATPIAYLIPGNYTYKKIIIKSVTGTGHYKLYGKRKWN